MSKRVLFYSSVKRVSLFHTQRFYHMDVELLKQSGCTVTLTNSLTSFWAYKKYDIAFIYFYRKGFFAALISKLFNKKVIFTGGIDALDFNAATKKAIFIQAIFFKLCNMFSDTSILVSKSDMRNVSRIYNGKLPENLILSHHTIPLEKYSVDVEKSNYCTTVAWMENKQNVIRKGIDKSLYILKYLLDRDENLISKYYIIGKEGEGSLYLKELAQSLGLKDKVEFTGELSEEKKIDLLLGSRYYFQLSRYEGFGIAALEALAAKNIVIHSGRGGLSDSICDDGIVFDLDCDTELYYLDFYKRLLSFDCNKLAYVSERLINHFSDEVRLNVLTSIVNS